MVSQNIQMCQNVSRINDSRRNGVQPYKVINKKWWNRILHKSESECLGFSLFRRSWKWLQWPPFPGFRNASHKIETLH
jgi:hypothetical protein